MSLKLPSALRLPPAVSSVLPGALVSRVGAGTVSVVRLNGVIAAASGPVPRSVINLQAVESALTRAFEAENAVAVALVINSPGGSPTQSQLVADRIRGLATEHELPVLAFCEDVAASGGYWLACAADEIFACPTSLVGSIGVVSGGFGLTGLSSGSASSAGCTPRARTRRGSTRSSRRSPRTSSGCSACRASCTSCFIEWVRSRRGNRARRVRRPVHRRGVDRAAGAGARADRRDRDPARGALASGSRTPTPVGVEPRKPLLARLGVGVLGGVPGLGVSSADPAAAVVGALEWLEQRAHWSRFGL